MAEYGEFLGYKGKPLVRCGDTIYYGKMTDPYVVMLQILETEQSHEMQMAKKVSLHLMKTDPTCNPLERIVKKGEQDSLYKAIDMASAWLDRALAEG